MTPMNTTPTNEVTDDGSEIRIASARLLLLNTIKNGEEKGSGNFRGLAHKRVINRLTGAAIHLPPKVPVEKPSGITTRPLKRRRLAD